MKTVQEFMDKEIPKEYHKNFKREFFKWSNEETTYGVFYMDDVLWMCADFAGVPRCVKCGKAIQEDDHYSDNDPRFSETWSEEDMEYCADCLFEKYF